ncbi:hypothetical protein [Chryseobacterium taklimakanense]|uniref:hypothetical protein n=1 Tax=Chryseobacterium taklimakanense TaxID=536441 RepID=UPI0023F66279|nr:hypothetical protein [Chryseobacterium taklimakanense]
MMDNILKKWDIRRTFYLLGGIFFIVTAIKDQIWWVAIFGIYFISMAVFRFGCAAGNCKLRLTQKEEKP